MGNEELKVSTTEQVGTFTLEEEKTEKLEGNSLEGPKETIKETIEEHGKADTPSSETAELKVPLPSNPSKTEHKRILEEDSSVVASHYNARPAGDRIKRQKSDIIFIRNFNNWAKSVLIQMAVKRGDRVLDLGCGKGGDLQKWRKQGVSKLVGIGSNNRITIDIAEVSLEEARRRFEEMSSKGLCNGFDAQFLHANPYKDSIHNLLKNEPLFDVVSSQFSFHYCFSSEENVRAALQNVSTHLRVGGCFIATVPDPFEIQYHPHNFSEIG